MSTNYAVYGKCPHCGHLIEPAFGEMDFIWYHRAICPKCGNSSRDYRRVVGRWVYVKPPKWWQFWKGYSKFQEKDSEEKAV